MSEIFEGYERQYCEVSANLSRKCASVLSLHGEEKKHKLSELKTGLDEAESLIRRMDLEARSLPPTQKATLLAKLREYKSDLNNLKRESKKVSSAQDPVASRNELMEAGMADHLMSGHDERNRLLMSTETLNQSGERIKESKRTLLETEELGVSILQDLHIQRQTLRHAQSTLHGVDDNIGKSRRILNSMGHRLARNKWILGSIISVLAMAIVLVTYVKLKS
jgi:vesicle transport through interaction with t-SNAREs protein 1